MHGVIAPLIAQLPTHLAKWNIPKGIQYLVGKIANSPVGAIQFFVGNAGWLV